ncbi:Right handed beta helix region [Sphingomonas gellani]|uniref:Right handed beta helix region n=1 Tax=Sphingomonas gellani TaxID=1166340 RepID=A0A1H8EE83_9SPHN|nr:right-handed parallel beta-helix repeat-containing protein [Sphingomonas gellani]SEN17881.1 Right handed beta helix region [Sphingomonas gellani]
MRYALVLAALVATPALGQSGPFSVDGRGYGNLQEAVNAIGDGDGMVTIAPGVYRQCAVQERGRIVFKAAQPGKTILEGVSCEDKAGLVLRGRGSQVDGLIFRGYAVGDHNGAGIRTERGDLLVVNSMFLDSEQGILGGTRGTQRVTIERSTFSGSGKCRDDGECSHSLYLTSGTVTVRHCRFQKGRGGHYIKLRAPRVNISDNIFDDTGGRQTSRMIDLPEGAVGQIARNTFIQGTNKDNAWEMIAIRAEKATYPSAGLKIEGNTASVAPGQRVKPAFIADFSGERLLVGQNTLAHTITPFASK